MIFDIANKDEFMSNKLKEATELVANLVTSNYNHFPEYDRRSRGAGNNKAIKDLSAQIDMILKA